MNAFVYNKVIERVAYTPKLLDYACHVLNNQPRLSEQILMCQDHTHNMHNFHLRKDSDVQIREDGPRFYTDPVNRRVYMDHVSFFVYLLRATYMCHIIHQFNTGFGSIYDIHIGAGT